ncbi:MAG TPA: serine hydrolase [Actinomycetes bacterium]|jgi:CubicO group peptidase (beta-lactamase class C family)|nr:serine hydrolase [Actinomycetes bacterium]
MATPFDEPTIASSDQGSLRIDDLELKSRIDGILNRHPAVGLAVGVVRDGRLGFFYGHGIADIASNTPITADTVFRIGSVTKTFTAIAVMQLREQGLIDLDAPANDYLRAYELIPAQAGFRPATVRHLLTHTSGIPEARHASDLFHPEAGPFEGRPLHLSVKFGEPLPSLAEYYRGGLREVAQPGTAFAYSNHGFATLGQIVEDVSGMPLGRYFRERIFQPLGMQDTDLLRSERVALHLATGYALGRRGAEAVPDLDWTGPGGGGIYSTTRDIARFAAALMGSGTGEHGSVLEPATLATMFEPHHRPDPRLPGWGLGFARAEAGTHRVVGHDGILPGFNSDLLVAPDDGVGVVAFTNGSKGAFMWMEAEFKRLLRHLLDVPDEVIRTDIAHHPEVWEELCGRYRLPPRISDLRQRLLIAGGVEVFVRGGRLMIRALTPIPALYRGLPLHPDDEDDPYAFRLDLWGLGMSTVRVVFGRDVASDTAAIHTSLGGQPLSLIRRPTEGRARGPRTAALGALLVATTA